MMHWSLTGARIFVLSFALLILPQTELAMRGPRGVAKGPWKVRGAVGAQIDQEKCILGDTCSRLAYAKQSVASSNINIYNRKSTLFTPDRSWGQLASWARDLVFRLGETQGRELKHQYLE